MSNLVGATTAGPGKLYFPQLTGVRAVAAYAVYLYHFNPFPRDLAGGALYWFGTELHVGVTFFFVLSGFLIYLNYGRSQARPTAATLKPYAQNRFARIYPVYFLVLMSTYLLIGWPRLDIALIHLTLTQALFPPYMMTGISQAWTLTVEETFYFSAPFIFLAAQRWSLAVPVAILVGLGFFLSAMTGNPQYVFGRTLCGAILPFAAGIVLARLTIKNQDRLVSPRRGVITGISLAACVLLVALMAYLARQESLGAGHNPLNSVIVVAILPIAIACLYWGLLFERSWTRALLATRWAVLLGGASYAFYLIHQGALQTFLDHAVRPPNLVRFVLLNIAAVLLFVGFERPANLWLRARPTLGAAPVLKRRAWTAWTAILAAVVLLPVLADLGSWFVWQRAPLASLLASCRGDLHLAGQQTAAAMADYQAAVELDPENRLAQEQLGAWHLLEGRPTEALAFWTDVTTRWPDDPLPRLRLGMALAGCGRIDEAMTVFEKLLATNPNWAEAYNALGLAWMQRNRPSDAVAYFQRAVELEPSSAPYHTNLGATLVRLGRLHDARAHFQLALTAQPQNAEAQQNLRQVETMLAR